VHLKYLQDKTPDEIEAHFYAFYDINKEDTQFKHESLNRAIISQERDEYGEFHYDKELSKANEEEKNWNLKKIKERNEKIFG
jgi:galactose-1-phosphate uridylyltransferase